MKLIRKGQDKVQELFKALPDLFKRARTSALKGTGFEIRKRLRKHIKTAQFKALHPLRQKMQRTKGGRWRKRTGNARPLLWLQRFAQYYMVDDENVAVSLRDAEKGQLKSGTRLDKSIIGILEKHEHGHTYRLTEAMRDELSEGIAKAGLKFLKHDTTEIKVPERPIIEPVYRSVKSQIPKIFKTKFMRKLRQYTADPKKKDDSKEEV